MRDYIRINYEKLSLYSTNLGGMIRSLEDCKAALEKAGEALAPAHGESIGELENRRLMTIDTIDGAIERMGEAKQTIIDYRMIMKDLVPTISYWEDVQINRADYEEFIKTTKEQVEAGFEAAPISPTYDQYLITRWNEFETWEEDDWDRYRVEEANGSLVEDLRNSQRLEAYNKVKEKLSEIENEYNEYILPFFEADAEWVGKLSQIEGFMTSQGFEKQLDEWDAEYEKLMPGGVPNWDYFQEIMQMNPEDVTIAQLQGISRMYDYFQRYFDAEPIGDDDSTRKWADENLRKFFQMCYVDKGISFNKGGIFPDLPELSPVLERLGLVEKEHDQSNRPHLFTLLSPTAMYVVEWLTLDRLYKGKPIGGFQADTNQGIFHSKYKTWQRFLGFTHFFDLMFFVGTLGQMDKAILTAPVTLDINGVSMPIEMVLWTWKGNYMNLGAGAETGSYFRILPLSLLTSSLVFDTVAGYALGDKGSFPMKLTLYDKDNEVVFCLEPDGRSWWPAGFKPSFQDPIVGDLTAVTEIQFVKGNDWDEQVYEAYRQEYDVKKKRPPENTVIDFKEDEHNYIMTITHGSGGGQ